MSSYEDGSLLERALEHFDTAIGYPRSVEEYLLIPCSVYFDFMYSFVSKSNTSNTLALSDQSDAANISCYIYIYYDAVAVRGQAKHHYRYGSEVPYKSGCLDEVLFCLRLKLKNEQDKRVSYFNA